MIIRYYAHPPRAKKEVCRDLSREKILEWEILPESRLGFKGGNLSIRFDAECSPEPIPSHGIDSRGGIYPPIPDILNYDETLNYLREKFGHLEKVN